MSEWQKSRLVYETVVGTVNYVVEMTPLSQSVLCLATGEGTLFGVAKSFSYLCAILDV